MTKSETVKINFYRVTKCGYYGFGDKAPQFGGLHDLLVQLKEWGSGVEVALTKLISPKKKAAPSAYPVYLFGIENKKNDWVFATWNEVPSTEGAVASVGMHDIVGEATVHDNPIEENTIPGYATYFWVMPDKNLIATLRFQHQTNGQTSMQQYLEDFLATSTKYTLVNAADPAKHLVMGYTDLADGKPKKVQPSFKTAAYVKPGVVDYIYENHASIRKVLRRGHLSKLSKVDRDAWQSFIRFLRGSDEAAKSVFVNQNAYVELEYTPTLEELKTMVEAELSDYTTTHWDDLGFIMKGDPSKKHWVSRSSASGDATLNITRINTESIDLQSLLDALDKHRDQIMKILDE